VVILTSFMADKRVTPLTQSGLNEGSRSGQASASLDPDEWVERFGDFLYRYALIRVRKPDIAEDLVQETLLAALRSKRQYDGRSSVGGWLTGILRHKITDHFRRINRELPPQREDGLPPELESRFDEFGHWKRAGGSGPSEWGPDASTLMERKEFMAVFKACLGKLPPRSADAFVLREMEGTESEMVQQILGVTASNFWVLMHRARMQLRQCLETNWIRG